MMRVRVLLATLLILALGVPSFPDEAKAAFNRGVRAESQKEYDTAYDSFKQAYALNPKDPKYVTAYLRARATAGALHINNGLKLRENHKLQESMAEFQRAMEIDSTNFVAAQELRRTAMLIKKLAEPPSAASNLESPLAKLAEEAEGVLDLQPVPNTPISLRMTTTADNIYRTIGKLGGINVLFDLDYKPQRITIELNEVMVREALRMVALESKSIWRPISPTAIFVASESKRKEFETSILKTFYLRNASTPAELQEVVGTLKGILDINRIQVNPTHSAITLRGTPDQMVLAEKLIDDVDKPKGEVVIDIAVMEISKTHLTNIGTVVPTSDSIAVQAATGGTGGAAGLVKIGSLNGNSFVVGVPSVSFNFLLSDSNTKVLQRPQLRALDNEKATLRIGDRIPIATGSFGAAAGGANNLLVNTQFQYLDVGVNIDITPHIHSHNEVTLKMVLEISSQTGTQTIGGISQPVIGQRRIEHETRLEDGDINLVGGILEDSETTSLSGYPWLAKIPILKYLFGQENKQHNESEIVFAITPHIVRAEEITDENLRLIDVGTSNTIGLRYREPKSTKPTNSQEGSSSKNRKQPSDKVAGPVPAPARPTDGQSPQ